METISRLLAPLAAYPRWLVVVCLVLAAIAAGWALLKAVKWAFYLLLAAALLFAVLLAVSWLVG